jgi:hypothetical protein
MIGGLQLVMSQGPQPGQAFALDRDTLTLGRDPSNAIAINEPQVSRQHARITQQGNATVVEDLGSTNGTYVNGMLLTGPRALTPGDVISLGEAVTLTFYSAGAVPTEDLGAPPAPAGASAPAYGPPVPGPQPYEPPPYEPGPVAASQPPEADYRAADVPVADVYATEEDLDGEGDSKRRQVLFIGCGCLALTLACLAVALFLWYAPAAFWDFLIDLGIPVPGNPF